jgi:hypothetical protein
VCAARSRAVALRSDGHANARRAIASTIAIGSNIDRSPFRFSASRRGLTRTTLGDGLLDGREKWVCTSCDVGAAALAVTCRFSARENAHDFSDLVHDRPTTAQLTWRFMENKLGGVGLEHRHVIAHKLQKRGTLRSGSTETDGSHPVSLRHACTADEEGLDSVDGFFQDHEPKVGVANASCRGNDGSAHADAVRGEPDQVDGSHPK